MSNNTVGDQPDPNSEQAIRTFQEAIRMLRNMQVVAAGRGPIPPELYDPLVVLTYEVVNLQSVLYDKPPSELFDHWFKTSAGREDWEKGMEVLRERFRTEFLPRLEAERKAQEDEGGES
jgi:hypothetical protein